MKRKRALKCKKSNHFDLPEDVVIDIVSRLPVKSLKRFRCICKTLCARFENPDFINNHHLKQKNANNISLLVKRSDDPLFTHSTYFFELTQALNVKENICMPFLDSFTRVLGPHNGILCLHAWHKIALWNPATREFKILPESSVERPPSADSTYFSFVGFGYDSKTNDYKVVRSVENSFNGGFKFDYQYELYTLSSDSWREIHVYDKVRESNFTGFTCFDIYVNGCCHQLLEGTDDRAIVLSFDMVDEVFSTVPLANFGVSWTEYDLLLASINESLAAIVYLRKGMEKCFDIWVMKEYGVKESWTKHLTIGPIYGVDKPIGLWKNRELYLESNDNQVILYDLQTQELNNLQIESFEDLTLVVNFVESLVPINGKQELEEHIFRMT